MLKLKKKYTEEQLAKLNKGILPESPEEIFAELEEREEKLDELIDFFYPLMQRLKTQDYQSHINRSNCGQEVYETINFFYPLMQWLKSQYPTICDSVPKVQE